MGTDDGDGDDDNNDDDDDGDGDGDKPENEWCGQLPQVPEVKRILLRQQTRRRWYSEGLAEIFAHLPRLSELCYEPWRDWDAIRQEIMDESEFVFLSTIYLRHHILYIVIV